MVKVKRCNAVNCTELTYLRGYCHKHYDRWRRSNRFTPRPVIKAGTCLADGCTTHSVGKGLCWKHYRRALRSDYRRATYACLIFHAMPYWLLYLQDHPMPEVNFDDLEKPRKRRCKAVARPISPNAKRCSLDGCDNPMNARGLCGRHYRVAERDGTLPPLAVKLTICAVEGCPRTPRTKGYCQMHYARFWKHGTTELIETAAHRTHGMCGTITYHSWVGMIQRCTNPKATDYAKYGGKNIKVCDRWRYSFANFYADMGERPEGKTIHRIDPDGDYEPGNCKWATTREQALQKRLSRTNKSGYRGVHFDKGAWVTTISLNNKTAYLGRYKTKEEAARTYNQAAIVHFGPEAMLNAV